MPYDINAALERLENNLREVESAKKQVEETIATSESLQQVIGQYSDSLAGLSSEISNFIAEVNNYKTVQVSGLHAAIDKIKTSCHEVINKFNVEVNANTEAFRNKLTQIVSKVSSENDKLAAQVNKLNSLYEAFKTATNEVKEIEYKLDGIAKDLKESQEGQDRALENLQSSIEGLPAKLNSHIDDIIECVNNQILNLNDKADEIKTSSASAIQKLDNIISTLSETKTVCNGIKSDIAELKKSMESAFSEVKSAVNINRWILIIGIIVLVALHFIKL